MQMKRKEWEGMEEEEIEIIDISLNWTPSSQIFHDDLPIQIRLLFTAY
jgi:hypothetical protein